MKNFVAQQLKNKELEFAVQDPDAPENFPRNLIVWRANLITSSSKGHEYFMKHLLGTKDGLLESDTPAVKPTEIKWREEAGKGKLDLLIDLDFRMAGSASIRILCCLPPPGMKKPTYLLPTCIRSCIRSSRP